MKCLACGKELEKPFVGAAINGLFCEWKCSCEFGWSMGVGLGMEYRRKWDSMNYRWHKVPEGCLGIFNWEEE